MKRFNIIDVIIVLVIVALVAGVALLKRGQAPEDKEKVLVTVELTEKLEGFSDNVVIGDVVTEKVQKVQIGKIVDKEVKPTEVNTFDRITGETFTATVPERENVYVTIEMAADGDIAIGKLLSIMTKHFMGAGYIVEIEDAE